MPEAATEGAGRGNKGRKKTDKASSYIANRAASVSRSRAQPTRACIGVYGAVER